MITMLSLTNKTLETQFAMNCLPERKMHPRKKHVHVMGKNVKFVTAGFSFENCWDLKSVFVVGMNC